MNTGYARLIAALTAIAIAAPGVGAPARAQDAGPGARAGDAGASGGDAGVGAEGGVAGPVAGASGGPPAEQVEPGENELPDDRRPEVTLRVEPREGLVTGDRFRVIVTVRLRDGDDVGVPRQSFGAFELHDQRHRVRPIDGGRREYVFEIDLLALEPGEHVLPSLRLRVVTAEGVVGIVRTEAQTIRVGSLVANEPDAQPRPATRPLPVMEDDYTLAWILGILGSMALTALLTWRLARWWSRRSRKAPPPPPPRPAWEVALEKLSALAKNSGAMIEAGRAVELVDAASDALREYLGARYGFNGLESTTDEVISRLRSERLQGVTLQEITAILGDCDLAKFAKAVPTKEQCQAILEEAVRIVRATVPSAPAIAPPAAGAGYGAASGPGGGRPVPGAVPGAEAAVVTRGGPVALPLVVDRADAVDPVVSAAVLGAASSKASDPSFDGTIVVALSPDLPDEFLSRQAIRAVHEKLARALEGQRTIGGRPIRLVIEHYHERILAKGSAARRTIYGPGLGEERRNVTGPSAVMTPAAVRAGADTKAAAPPREGRAEHVTQPLETVTHSHPDVPVPPGSMPSSPEQAPRQQADRVQADREQADRVQADREQADRVQADPATDTGRPTPTGMAWEEKRGGGEGPR
jgi:hypothetical protein